jgi:ubiquinone/menaquinone biosynthesis C-methylase UbiE
MIPLEQKDAEQVRTFWDSTGEWRLRYFDDLKLCEPESLPPALQLEREFVIAEAAAVAQLATTATSVLELGCGVGRSLFPLMRADTATFVGIDFAIGQLELFQRELDRRGLRNTFPIASDVGALPLRSETFDTVWILNQTFGTFLGATRDDSLREARRVLRPSGTLFIGGFSAHEYAQACYDAWNVQVLGSDSTTGIVELQNYRSLWAPEATVISEIEAKGFRLRQRAMVRLGYLHLYAKQK